MIIPVLSVLEDFDSDSKVGQRAELGGRTRYQYPDGFEEFWQYARHVWREYCNKKHDVYLAWRSQPNKVRHYLNSSAKTAALGKWMPVELTSQDPFQWMMKEHSKRGE